MAWVDVSAERSRHPREGSLAPGPTRGGCGPRAIHGEFPAGGDSRESFRAIPGALGRARAERSLATCRLGPPPTFLDIQGERLKGHEALSPAAALCCLGGRLASQALLTPGPASELGLLGPDYPRPLCSRTFLLSSGTLPSTPRSWSLSWQRGFLFH